MADLRERRDVTGNPRPERLAITPDRLEAVWPEARVRLIRSLTSRGADEHTAEDIAQEVALRAMDRTLHFSDVDDFCRWGCTVARNLYVDQTRQRGRMVAMTDVPDWSGDPDVPEQVEHRITLGRTLRGLAMLGETDRTAILSGVNETVEGNRRVANRSAVRRHRARVRLLRLVEGLAAIWASVKGTRRIGTGTAVAMASTVAIVLVPGMRPDSTPPETRLPQALAPTTGHLTGVPATRDPDAGPAGIRRAGAAPAAAVPADPAGGRPAAAPPRDDDPLHRSGEIQTPDGGQISWSGYRKPRNKTTMACYGVFDPVYVMPCVMQPKWSAGQVLPIGP